MAIFSKIFGVAGAVVVFTGLAYGQATCAAPSANSILVRSEGKTEQVGQLSVVCSTGANTAAAGSVNLQVQLSQPITSKITTSSNSTTEAVAVVNGGAPVQGTLSSANTLSFTVPVDAIGAGASYTFQISNVRVDATATGGSTPTPITETVFVSGPAATINTTVLSPVAVAYAENSITSKIYKTYTVQSSIVGPPAITAPGFPTGSVATSGAGTFVVCNAYSPKADAFSGAAGSSPAKSLAFALQVSEVFPAAFKAASEGPQVAVTGNAAATHDRIKVVFTNVPSNVTLYVPTDAITSQTWSTGNGAPAKIQLTSSETGAFAAVTPASSVSALNGLNLAPVSGTAIFDVQAEDNVNIDSFNIPVFAVTTANSVPASSTAITAQVSYAPVGASQIPNFVVGSSTTTLTGSTFSACTTSLLFPFVTNQLGFDTGIAIANTSTDPFGSNGATPQAGTCTLNFYGNGAPSPANVTTANIATGTVFTQVLSGVAAGFQGYMIAQCNFQFAHGFAFITDGVGANGGLSQGYLAGVIPDVNQAARSASPFSSSAAGTGETLGN